MFLMSRFFQSPDYAAQYRAIGLVRGQYLPSLDAFEKGVLLTDDGEEFAAVMFDRLAQQLQKHPERINTLLFWSVWPKTLQDEQGLFLELNALRSSRDEQQQTRLTRNINYFSIRGVVVAQDAGAGKLIIRIERNRTTQSGKKQDEHLEQFNLEISGFLPGEAVGQFWDLDCCRDGQNLVMEDAHLVEAVPLRLETSIKAETQRRDDSPKRTKTAPKPGTKKANAPQPAKTAQFTGDIMPTPGKMELIVKISEFPADIRTVENGWKQFDVDTGDQLVTITVKPKVFKKLEQAQENYPQWVAAIAGQMGEKTDKGFVLKEPNIQVFERKPKEPKEAAPPVANAPV
jgi:hypothetical protein